MSAMNGTSMARRNVGMFAALCSSGMVTRIISQPASCKVRIWATVAAASWESVLVIDCTRTGCSLPMVRLPTGT